MPDVGGVAGDRLKSFIERVERLEEEKKAIAEDIKEVMGEAKSTGFDPKIIRKVIKLRKMDNDARQEEEYLTDLYLAAIGEGMAPPMPQAMHQAQGSEEITDTDNDETSEETQAA